MSCNSAQVYWFWEVLPWIWIDFILLYLILTHCGLVMPYGDFNRPESTLTQVMACYLMALSFYLNQCWLLAVYVKNFHGPSDICLRGFIYSIQICEISHETFGPSHRKCPTCPMFFAYTAFGQCGPVKIFWWQFHKLSLCVSIEVCELIYK